MSDLSPVGPADLTVLRGLLARFEQQWRERDTLTLRYVRPGLTDEQQDRATQSLGLVLPVEARAWFGWHDGVNHVPGDVQSAYAHRVGPPMDFCTLEVCVAATRDNREMAQEGAELGIDPDYAWPPSWFVLGLFGNGDPLIIDCAVPSGAVTPIRTTDWPELEDQRRVRVASLTDLVGTWVKLVDDGIYSYDPALGYWLTDSTRLTEAQLRAAVY